MSKVRPQGTRVRFLYHPLHKEAKAIYIDQENALANEEELISQGWSRERFAQSLYHRKHGQKIVRSASERDRYIKQGWTDAPITDPAKTKGAHPDIVHPHHNDDMRQNHLADLGTVKVEPVS